MTIKSEVVSVLSIISQVELDYPLSYERRSISEQIHTLRRWMPELKFGPVAESIAQQTLPIGAEDYYAIPMWQFVAENYWEAVEKILGLIKKQRGNLAIDLGCGGRLRQSMLMTEGLGIIHKQQSGCRILVVPGQFGIKYRSRSSFQARRSFKDNEFGLGAFEVGCMILANPHRLEEGGLGVECPGNEYHRDPESGFPFVPFFRLEETEIQFGTRLGNNPSPYYGSVSAFLHKRG
jgi:hypothetical protein